MLSRRAGSISPSPTLAIDAKAKQMAAEGKKVINFGVGEPDFDTPLHIREAAIRAIQNGFTRYTAASGITELKEAVCAKLARDSGLEYSPNQIVVSNGAKHSLSNTFAALLNDGDEVIIPSPYWVSYPELVRLSGGVPVVLETSKEQNFKIDPAELKNALTARTKAIILNSPSNPTGQVYTKKELAEIAVIAVDNNIFVISDEVYEKFIYTGEHLSIASLGEDIKAQTVLINGASKTYAMTGWRIGYSASTAQIAGLMANIQSHATSNPNSIAQVAACAALNESQECVVEMGRAFEARRNFMVERFNQMDLVSCLKPEGAFYAFVDIAGALAKHYQGKQVKTGTNFAEILLEKYLVTVVPGEGFGAPEYIRLSYATSMDNIQEGLDRFHSFLNDLDD